MTNTNPSSRAAFPRTALAATLLVAAWLPLTTPAQGLRPSGKLGESALPTRPASATQRAADYIVAVVNSEPITNNELRARLVRIEQQMTQQGAALPAREVLARQVLERLISEKAQLQVGHETGIKIDDAAVDQAELSVARQNEIGVPEMRRRLTQDGIALSQFREELG